MKNTIIYLAVFVFTSQANAQYDPPEVYPVVGWDSLKSLIVYPEIAKRAGVQGNVDVSVEFDSLGNVGKIQIVGYELFHQPVIDTIKKVTWAQKYSNSIKKFAVAYFTIEFKLKQYERPLRRILRIEKEKPLVHIDY